MLALLLLLGCPAETQVSYEQFNAEGESVVVHVGADCDADPDLCEAVSTPLHSSTGQVEVGTASVDPGGGPVGTEHLVRVDVSETYTDDVDRVTVRTASGGRGEDEYDLEADSAGAGIWVLDLASVGEEGEVREDTFTFRLWTALEE